MIKKKIVFKVFFFILSLFIAVVFFFPIYWMLISSVKTNAEIFHFPPDLIPQNPKWSNYSEMINFIPFGIYFKNSMIVSLLAVVGELIAAPPAAYAFSKMHWKGREAAFVAVLMTMMLPFQVMMIPLYTMFRKIGWIGTLLPLTIPNFFGHALYIFLLRQFMSGIPDEICESAVIDGAGHIRILYNIIFPLIKPALVSVGLFMFIANWGDYTGPLVFLNKNDKLTLAVGLTHFTGGNNVNVEWGYMIAACVLYTAPILALFSIAQKQFVEGISFSGIKG